jgi:hypothetical protein
VSIEIAKSFDILFVSDDRIIQEMVRVILAVLSTGQYE